MVIWVIKIFFCVVILFILAISSWSLLLLLGHYCFCPYCAHLCMKYSFDISNLLEENSSLSLFVFFLYFFALFIEEGLVPFSSLWYSAFSWVYLSLSPFLFTSLLSSGICKASSDNHFVFLHFFFCGMVFFIVSCTLWTSVHSYSGTLFTRSNPLNLFVTSTVYS